MYKHICCDSHYYLALTMSDDNELVVSFHSSILEKLRAAESVRNLYISTIVNIIIMGFYICVH